MLTLWQTAKRVLDESCGPNMNAWFVGRHPVGHETSEIANKELQPRPDPKKKPKVKHIQLVHDAAGLEGEKTFFMKARIFAGQADVKEANGQYEDFQWLAKEEIEKKVHPRYWSKVKNMLVEQ